MRIARIAISVLVLTGRCIASPDAQIIGPAHRIDLSGHGEFKNIFEAGLQPKRFDDNLGICIVKRVVINFDLGGSNTIIIPADECYFKVLEDYSLYTIEANTVPLTLEEARRWMLPICRTFGTPDRELDNFLDRVGKGKIEQFGWLGAGETDGFVVGMPRQPQNSDLAAMGARLRSVSGDKVHPVEIVADVTWERATWKLAGRPPKLTPPKGYEQFSMEPVREVPEWIRTGAEAPNFVKALNTPEQIQAMRDEYYRTQGRAAAPTNNNAPPATVGLNRVNLIASSPFSLKWALLLLAPVFFLAGVWVMAKRR